ncbi:MAG TPA: Smr/MutS family protein [Vicinamibacterales bacterium]|nr:Smr/MutS family protein [Vicinamibacterales bacterium]
MPFTTGERVHLTLLGTGVVREVRNRGRYVVEIKGQSFVVDETQMSAVEESKRRRAPPVVEPHPSAPDIPAHGSSPSQLDLHGLTTVEAVAALDGFINEAILAGHETVSVIHGRSGGRLKAAVHARLRDVSSVRRFGVDPRNSGVTILWF